MEEGIDISNPPTPSETAPASSAVDQEAQREEHLQVVDFPRTSGRRAAGQRVASEDEAIRCVCESVDDDGFTIQCDECLVWQHAMCVGIMRETVPDNYFCELCRPELHQKDGYWISGGTTGVSSGGGRKVTRKTSMAVSAAKLNLVEISTSVLSREVAAGFEYVAQAFYSELLAEMPLEDDPSRVNFELWPNLVAFPNLAALQASLKPVEIREIRGRGAAKRSLSSGLPGSLRLGLFARDDLDPGVLVQEYTGHVHASESLFSAKKKAHPERVSHSQVLFVPHMTPSICVDARKQGNAARHIRRSCRPNCEIKLVLSGGKEASDVHLCVFTKRAVQDGDELLLPIDFEHGNEYFRCECACGSSDLCLAPEAAQAQPRASVGEAYAVRERTSSTVSASTKEHSTHQRTKTPTPALASALAAAVPAPKLSREERKMQQYIEQIDRMDTAAAGKRSVSRKSSSSGMASSASNMPEAGSSPKRAESPRSPKAVLPRKQSILDEEVKQHAQEEEEGDVSNAASPRNDPKIKKEKKNKKATTRRPRDGPESIPELPETASFSSASSWIREEADEAGLVDVVRADVSGSSTPIQQQHTPPPQFEPADESSPSERETPSKKRVSLSDYMKKRKEREEGELPPPAVPEVSSYEERPRRPYYQMPPHLTPPPPLASQLDQVYPPRSESVSYPSRSESAAPVYPSSYQQQPQQYRHLAEQPRAGSFDSRHHPRRLPEEPSAAATRYGYTGRDPYEQPGVVHRPRPSLLKAAHDLPTRWEEASRGLVEQREHRPSEPIFKRSYDEFRYEEKPPRREMEPRRYDPDDHFYSSHRRSFPSGYDRNHPDDVASSRPSYHQHQLPPPIQSQSPPPPAYAPGPPPHSHHPGKRGGKQYGWKRPSGHQNQQRPEGGYPPPPSRRPP